MTEAGAKTTNGATVTRAAVPAVAGAGATALLMALLNDYPAVVTRLVDWGPGLLIIVLVAHYGSKVVPVFVTAATRMSESNEKTAASIGALTRALDERFRAEDDVRMACRALTGQVERLGEKLDEKFEALVAEIWKRGGTARGAGA